MIVELCLKNTSVAIFLLARKLKERIENTLSAKPFHTRAFANTAFKKAQHREAAIDKTHRLPFTRLHPVRL